MRRNIFAGQDLGPYGPIHLLCVYMWHVISLSLSPSIHELYLPPSHTHAHIASGGGPDANPLSGRSIMQLCAELDLLGSSASNASEASNAIVWVLIYICICLMLFFPRVPYYSVFTRIYIYISLTFLGCTSNVLLHRTSRETLYS